MKSIYLLEEFQNLFRFFGKQNQVLFQLVKRDHENIG
jgi:hypothetical protein